MAKAILKAQSVKPEKPKKERVRDELPQDLVDLLDEADSVSSRIEILLIAMLRELKRIK